MGKTALWKVFNAQSLTTAGGGANSAYSGTVNIDLQNEEDYKAQYEIAGGDAGTISLEVWESLNGTDFAKTSATGNTIASGLTSASGTGSDGKGLIDISLNLAPHVKFRAVNSNTTAAATVSLWFGAR